MTEPAAPHMYRVLRQEHATQFGPDGVAQHVWTVHVEHADGTKGSVTLPEAMYTPETVHSHIMAQAANVLGVANLPATAAKG